jgi:dTDP-4-amino-4,6-dideoxygalactose transaminase
MVGFNYRMTDIQAAVGRVQLKRLPGLLERRVSLAAEYFKRLHGLRGLVPPHVPDYARSNFQSFAVRVTPEHPRRRDQIMQDLLEAGISSRRGIMNAHQEGAYPDRPRFRLPHSEAARDNVVLLPLFHEMTNMDVRRVVEVVAP